MKTINRVLTFFMVMLLLLVSFGCRKVELPTEGLVYELLEDGTGYAVVDYTGESLDVVVPSSYLGLPVTTITSSAFHNKHADIVSISLPDTVTSIQEGAIGCLVNLKEFRVPKEIEDIGSALTGILTSVDIKIPRDHKYLKATTISFNRAVISKDKTKLVWVANPKKEGKTIRIPASIKIIGAYAMAGTNFGEIILPDSVDEIHVGSFYGTDSTTINIPTDVEIIEASAFSCSSFEGVLVLPEGLEEIGNGAFSSNRLTEIVFPSTLTSLHYSVFGNEIESTQFNLVTRVEFKTEAFVPHDDLVDWFVSFIGFNYILSASSYRNESPNFVIEIVFSANDVDFQFMEQAFWEAHETAFLDSDYLSLFTFETECGPD